MVFKIIIFECSFEWFYFSWYLSWYYNPCIYCMVVFQVCVLGDLGGRTVDEAIKRMMKFLITNDVTMMCNFSGRHGKKPFGSSQLFDVVYSTFVLSFILSRYPKIQVVGWPTFLEIYILNIIQSNDPKWTARSSMWWYVFSLQLHKKIIESN